MTVELSEREFVVVSKLLRLVSDCNSFTFDEDGEGIDLDREECILAGYLLDRIDPFSKHLNIAEGGK